MLRSAKFILFLFVSLGLFNCTPSDKVVSPRNLDMIYNPSSSILHPKFTVYNISDSTAMIVGEVDAEELLYNKAADEVSLKAQLQVKCNLYNLDRNDRLTDSSIEDFLFEKKEQFQKVKVLIKAKKGSNYILEIISIDKNRNSINYTFLNVDRRENNTSGDFWLVDTLNQNYLVKQDIRSLAPFRIKNRNYAIDSLNVFYFKRSELIPEYPGNTNYADYNFSEPDSIVVFYNDSLNTNLFVEEGTYYFTKENKPINGFALHQYSESFPDINYPKQLIKPLQYFGINDSIVRADSTGELTKLAVDDFWLGIAQNIDRSRDLVKVFYNRVVNANKYFTSFTEGWQTDRGMIYIIYGIPDYIFKSDLEEKWIYSPMDLGPGYSFTFNYYPNPFSLNHYILDRKKNKDTGWELMIKMWEKGEVIYYQK